MKLNLGISAMLVTAVLAGAAGGAVALSAAQDPATPAPAAVTLHQVADEDTAAPTAEPALTAEPSPAPVEADPAPADEPEPVSEPAPIVEDMPKPETSTEAADRAKIEADRAKTEADRAQSEAEKAATVPAPAPVVEPEPAAPECKEGARKSDPLIRDGQLRTALSYTCKDGAWVVTGSEKYKLDGGSDEPKAPTSGTSTSGTPADPKPAPVGAAD